MKKLNHPLPDASPLNQRDDMDLLVSAREAVRIAMNTIGFKETGCSIGIQCADVSVLANGKRIQIDIKLDP